MKRRVRSHPWTTQNSLSPPKKTQIDRARTRAVRESNCTSVTRTGQTTPPTVCCWDSTHYLHALARCVLYDDCCVNFGSALRLALDVVIRTSCPILIFQAPDCLKLDYKCFCSPGSHKMKAPRLRVYPVPREDTHTLWGIFIFPRKRICGTKK